MIFGVLCVLGEQAWNDELSGNQEGHMTPGNSHLDNSDANNSARGKSPILLPVFQDSVCFCAPFSYFSIQTRLLLSICNLHTHIKLCLQTAWNFRRVLLQESTNRAPNETKNTAKKTLTFSVL
jgi:hypothetical protein